MRMLVVGCLFLLFGCQPAPLPVNLAGNSWLGYQPLYLAISEDECVDCVLVLDGKEQLQVTMLPSTTQVLRLLSNGQLDAAMLTLDEAMTFQSATEIDICIVSVLSYSNGADAVLTLPGFDPDKPFKIGYEETALGGYLLRRAVDMLSWSDKPFSVRTLVPRQHVPALIDKEVDVVITYEPYVSQLHKAGALSLLDSRQLPGEIIDILVVRTEIWQQRQALFLSLFADIWPKGLARIKDPDADALKILTRNTELTAEELGQALNSMVFPNYATSRPELAAKLAPLVNSMNDYLQQTGHINKPAALKVCG